MTLPDHLILAFPSLKLDHISSCNRTESPSDTQGRTVLPLPSQSVFPDTADLGDDVLSEFRVLDHSMGHTKRKKVDVSLYLIQHSLCVRHLYLVLHGGALVASNHTVNLFLNFGCRDMNDECYSRGVFPGHLEIT